MGKEVTGEESSWQGIYIGVPANRAYPIQIEIAIEIEIGFFLNPSIAFLGR